MWLYIRECVCLFVIRKCGCECKLENACVLEKGCFTLSITYPGVELSHHTFSLSLCECLGLLQSHGDLADLDLQLLAEGLGVLVVLLFLAQLLGEAAVLVGEAVGTLVGGTAGVDGLVEVGLHASDVGFKAALLVGDRGDADGELVDADSSLVQLSLGVLAGALSLDKARGKSLRYCWHHIHIKK